MKYKLSKPELKECIKEAVIKIITENKDDELLAQLLASDNKAGAAASAAGFNLPKPNGTGKRGRPKKDAQKNAKPMSPEEMDNEIINAANDEPEEEVFDKPDDIEAADDGAESFDKATGDLTWEELLSNYQTLPKNGAAWRRVNSEKKRRENILKDYQEENIPIPWGYKLVNGNIEPTHVSVQRDAWNPGSLRDKSQSVQANFGWGHNNNEW